MTENLERGASERETVFNLNYLMLFNFFFTFINFFFRKMSFIIFQIKLSKTLVESVIFGTNMKVSISGQTKIIYAAVTATSSLNGDGKTF